MFLEGFDTAINSWFTIVGSKCLIAVLVISFLTLGSAVPSFQILSSHLTSFLRLLPPRPPPKYRVSTKKLISRSKKINGKLYLSQI